jgi:hypothetical protein
MTAIGPRRTLDAETSSVWRDEANAFLSVETARDSAGLLLFRTDPMKRIARATN